MNLIKKLTLFVCIGLMPAKASAIGLETILNYTINTGVVFGAVASCFVFLLFNRDRAARTTISGKIALGAVAMGTISCTLHTGREVYRFFKPNHH